MRVSLNEIETITRKASIGAGLPFGLGEEIGEAARWLSGQNYDGIGAVLKSIRAGMVEVQSNAGENGVILIPDARVSICGPSIIDLLIGEKTCSSVQLMQADCAILLFGFAGVAASRFGRIFQFDFTNASSVLVSCDKVIETGMIPQTACDVTVQVNGAEGAAPRATMSSDGVEINDDIWREVNALAAKTYVRESGASRAGGAGAGLTDND